MGKLVPLPSSKLIAIFSRRGFQVGMRKSGDHIIMRKDGAPRPIVVPDYREVPVFIILNLMRTAGVDRETFLKILGEL